MKLEGAARCYSDARHRKLNRGVRVSSWCPFAACVYMHSTAVPRHFTGYYAIFLTAIWGFFLHEMMPWPSRWPDSTGQSERSVTETAANPKINKDSKTNAKSSPHPIDPEISVHLYKSADALLKHIFILFRCYYCILDFDANISSFKILLLVI